MEYFWLRQDHRCLHTPVMKDFYNKMSRRDFRVETAHQIPERNIMFCDADNKLEFADILDGQLFLVSKTVKQVFQMYERNLTFKFFCLLNNRSGEYANYYAPILPFIDCLSKGGSGSRNSIVLNRAAIASAPVFRVENQDREIVVVRLDLAESLLRRRLRGLELIRITQN